MTSYVLGALQCYDRATSAEADMKSTRENAGTPPVRRVLQDLVLQEIVQETGSCW